MYSLTGYIVIIFLIPVFTEINHLADLAEKLADSKKYFIPLAVTPLICLTIFFQIQYTEQTGAVWIFKFLPIKKPGEIIVSSLYVTLLNYFLPLSLFSLVILLLIWPLSILSHVVMVWGLSLLFIALFVYLSPKYLPLSRNRNMNNSTQNIGQMMLMLLVGSAVGGLMYGISLLPFWTSYIAGIIAIPIFLLVVRKIRTLNWSAIQN